MSAQREANPFVTQQLAQRVGVVIQTHEMRDALRRLVRRRTRQYMISTQQDIAQTNANLSRTVTRCMDKFHAIYDLVVGEAEVDIN